MTSSRGKNRRAYLNLYFQVHQPRRLKAMNFFDIGKGLSPFDDDSNRDIVTSVATNCYLPANEMFLDLIARQPRVRLAFSISGVALEQFMKYTPEVIDSFQRLASTGSVEFLAETYYHSLASVSDTGEFQQQVEKHRGLVTALFGLRPRIFRNTELIYSDEIGAHIADMDFDGIYADGIPRLLQGHEPHRLYTHALRPELRLLVRDYSLSDDVAFRFSNRLWKEWPLTADKWVEWLLRDSSDRSLINLGLDYETFGEHQKSSTGIFTFMREAVRQIGDSGRLHMVTPSEAVALLEPVDSLSSPGFISWADSERDLSAWLGNDMQRDAYESMRALGLKIRNTRDPALLGAWNYLQTSDHFYYMSTKKGGDGKVHHHFSPYASPYEAFMNYMNVLSDLSIELRRRTRSRRQGQSRRPQQMSRKSIGAA